MISFVGWIWDSSEDLWQCAKCRTHAPGDSDPGRPPARCKGCNQRGFEIKNDLPREDLWRTRT